MSSLNLNVSAINFSYVIRRNYLIFLLPWRGLLTNINIMKLALMVTLQLKRVHILKYAEEYQPHIMHSKIVLIQLLLSEFLNYGIPFAC